MTMVRERRIERWGATPAPATAPFALVNLLTGPNGVGKTAALDAVVQLRQSGDLEEPPDGPPCLVYRAGNGRERWSAETDLGVRPQR